MKLNPFEDKQNQYDLKEILEETDEFWTEYKVKKEYDGSEWWEFRTMPKIEQYTKTINKERIEKYIR